MNKPNISSYVKMCSKSIRCSFLDYFSNVHGHKLVKSSPVVPYCDNSIAFVNSGMCQFKNVFLGLSPAMYPRVANSQKCIRIGGKHNDLSCAGRDSYHHTLFEMLGNWSFNDYYKQDACRMALDFLTNPPISLPLNRLYFTYFGGNAQYGLPCDEETRNIWLQLGVPPAQIKEEGMRSNFWEMGHIGPCGYSTEIHFDMRGDPQTALSRLNADVNDLIEIWNIVFISYNRVSPDSFIPLSKNYVDTGLGFERLVTILQGKTSTYDTDLFIPLLETISKVSGTKPYGRYFAPSHVTDMDTNYRMLSDYSRMITVALADNMFPDATAKLRNVVRDALLISEDVFQVKEGKLLKELSYSVAQVLGESYPEIQDNINKIQLILSEESRIFDNLRNGAVKEWNNMVVQRPELKPFNILQEPGLVLGVKFLNKQMSHYPSLDTITGDMAFTLYDTFGLNRDIIDQLAATNKLKVDHVAFEAKLEQLKSDSKEKSAAYIPDLDHADLKDFPVTDDSYKYNYTYDNKTNQYIFPRVKNNLIGIVIGDELYSIDNHSLRHCKTGATVDSIQLEHNTWVGLIFDSTNLYSQAGGQVDDIGVAYLSDEGSAEFTKVEIAELSPVEGKIIHFGSVASPFRILPGVTSHVEVDAVFRTACMRAHTASHVLNAALRQVLTCTHQKSCRVLPDVTALDFSVYGETLSLEQIETIEQYMNDVITRRLPVTRRLMSSTELTALPLVTVIPGEVYPNDVSLIEISTEDTVISREPCCGTHVHSTGHIESCTILYYKSHNHGTRSIKCSTGESSRAAVRNGQELNAKVKQLRVDIQNSKQVDEQILKQQGADLKTLKLMLNSDEKDIPYVVNKQIANSIAELSKIVKLKLRELNKNKVLTQLKRLCVEDCPYVVHYINDDTVEMQAFPPLSEIYKPLLVLLYSSGELKARAYVPLQYCSPEFNARTWLTPLLTRIQGKAPSSKGTDANSVWNMSPVKLNDNPEVVIPQLIDIANTVAKKQFSRM